MIRPEDRESLTERLSLFVARSPSRAILLGILLFNIVFFLAAACVIALCAPTATKEIGFWESFFYTVSMVLDAGCVQYVVDGSSSGESLLTVVCIIIVIVGMISFTGAVIGYITTWISEFIRNANAGNRPLNISGHTVILNWNSRASEIINDLLYSERKEKVVVLVESGKEAIEREISDRLTDTLEREREMLAEQRRKLSPEELKRYRRLNRGMKSNVTVIVRQGTIYSSKQLRDISLSKARSVILLCNDDRHSICDAERLIRQDGQERNDPEIVKALIQVADITGAEESWDDQKIVVEVNDEWTSVLVDRIISHKERHGKCNIVPIPANRVLGRILSQLAIMPELNRVYSELLSNCGACFFSQRYDDAPAKPNEIDFVREYAATHVHAVPLTFADTKEGLQCFFMAESESDIGREGYQQKDALATGGVSSGGAVETRSLLALNPRFAFRQKNVLIIGSNSELGFIMEGFDGFNAEWGSVDGGSPLNLTVIHNSRSDSKVDDLQERYPYISKTICADVSDRQVIYDAVADFLDSASGSSSILLLSDDRAGANDIDADVLVNLIYVKDILRERAARRSDFAVDQIDVVVEILDPRNHDVVSSYDVNNVVISNRYISKMLTQISERDAIFDFYTDILSYDEEGAEFESKELYIKSAADFFDRLPEPCTADVLIRDVFAAGLGMSEEYTNHTIVLGYFRSGEMTLFGGDQTRIQVSLKPDDQLIIFSNH